MFVDVVHTGVDGRHPDGADGDATTHVVVTRPTFFRAHIQTSINMGGGRPGLVADD